MKAKNIALANLLRVFDETFKFVAILNQQMIHPSSVMVK